MIDHQMIKDGDKVLIGLSGGKDSMTLLFLLHYFKKKGKIMIYLKSLLNFILLV